MESIISTFHIDWKIIIAQAVNFGIVFVVLYIFALKPLNKLMTERADKIKKGIEDAKANASVLEKSQKEYDQVLVKGKQEANTMFQKVKKEAEEKKNAMINDAKNEVKAIIDNGKKNLETEKIKMVEDARREIASIAMLAAEKIIEDKMR